MKHKIDSRSDYLKGHGYDVIVEVTYRRKRRVHALDDEQAKEFAAARETMYVPKYFSPGKHKGFELLSVASVDAKKRDGDE